MAINSRIHQSNAWTGIIWPVLLLLLLVGCGGPSPVTTPTPTPTLPSLLQFTTFDLHLPAAALSAPIVGPLPDDTPLHVNISFKANQQVLDQLNQKKVPKGQNQNLPDLANKLGISDSEYQQLQAFFGVEHASLNLNKLHTDLTVDAKARSFARLFQVKFLLHKLNGRTFYTPDRNPQVPTFIANRILAITGLDNYSIPPRTGSLAQHHQLKTAGARKSPAADCDIPRGLLTWRDVAHLYGYDQLRKAGLDGKGITINLIEIDPFSQAEVQNYASCVYYQGTVKVVNVGNPPGKEEGESALDIEMIMGLAPAANIVDYQTDISHAQSDSAYYTLLNDELLRLIDDNTKNTSSGSLVSISLEASEIFTTTGDIAAIDQSLQILTKAEHMTVFIASSDCGAFMSGIYDVLSVSFPASDPSAVAVGGTVAVVDQKTNTLSEHVWSNGSDHSKCTNQWGSGGGLSYAFKRPAWQIGQGVQNKYSNGARQVPDVSALAWNLATYYQGYGWVLNGGTSAATPIWASGMALVNEGLIQQTHSFFYGPDLFYTVAQVGAKEHVQPYHDVTQGNNLYYPATPGWDFATGFGTPNLPDFYKTLLAMAKQS